jgi:hypothetical protein
MTMAAIANAVTIAGDVVERAWWMITAGAKQD